MGINYMLWPKVDPGLNIQISVNCIVKGTLMKNSKDEGKKCFTIGSYCIEDFTAKEFHVLGNFMYSACSLYVYHPDHDTACYR